MFAQLRRFMALGALICTGALAACIPDEQDPTKTSDAGQLNGSYYASALGNVALKVQNWVVGDPNWFAQTTSSNITLANLGIDGNVMGGTIRSSVCPTGTGTEVVQLTWLDGRDASNKFSMRGIGTNAGVMMGALRGRVAGDQVATYDGSTTLQVADGTTRPIPSSCSSLSIPLGAPVLVFQIDRPAAPVQELARTEYRTVACGQDARGMQMRGTMVESRIVRYTAAGMITPADPNTGWSAESMGTCVSDAIVTASSSTTAGGGSVALNNFADITANNLKAVLEQQLQMDCGTTTIDSDVMSKEQGVDVRKKKAKNIDTCTKASASAATSQVNDSDTVNVDDTRDVCVEKSTTFYSRTFLGVNGGTLTSAMNGEAYVDRTVDNRVLSSNASQTGERLKWIGRPSISCTSNDTFVAQCGQIPGAPPRSTDYMAAPNKWTTTWINEYSNNWDWSNNIFGICIGIFGDCEYVLGGTAYTLNDAYFWEKNTLHADTNTATAFGTRGATTWLDRFTNFTPNFVYGTFTAPSAYNQCRIRYKELQTYCPLSFNPSQQSSWYPQTQGIGFVTTITPGGSYGGKAGEVYNSIRNSGDKVGLVVLNHKSCNIKGCNHYNTSAGPGTDSYLFSWMYGDASSYNGAGTTVQTTMLNTEPQMYDFVPNIVSGPRMSFSDREYLPGRGLYCGRLEKRAFSWPTVRWGISCGGKGGCSAWQEWSSVTAYEVVRREWYGENASVGSWSQPVVGYEVNGSYYNNYWEIPNPIWLPDIRYN